MVQTLFCSKSRLSMQRHCATAGIIFLAEQTLFPSQPTSHENGSLQILQCQGIGGSTGQRNSIWAFWSSLAYFLIWAQQWNRNELYAVHGSHGIDVALLETTSLLLNHLTLWLLIGPKQCNFKKRQSWALHTEAISTTKEVPHSLQFKECQSMLKG